MNEIGAVSGEAEKTIDEFFCAGDFEARAESSAGINQGDEILRVTFGGMFKKREGFIETIRLPECAGLLQFREVYAETGDGLDGLSHGAFN